MKGGRFTGHNGGTIFLPAAGGRWDGELNLVGTVCDYWSSTPDDEYSVYVLDIQSSGAGWGHWTVSNVYEHPVRPVR